MRRSPSSAPAAGGPGRVASATAPPLMFVRSRSESAVARSPFASTRVVAGGAAPKASFTSSTSTSSRRLPARSSGRRAETARHRGDLLRMPDAIAEPVTCARTGNPVPLRAPRLRRRARRRRCSGRERCPASRTYYRTGLEPPEALEHLPAEEPRPRSSRPRRRRRRRDRNDLVVERACRRGRRGALLTAERPHVLVLPRIVVFLGLGGARTARGTPVYGHDTDELVDERRRTEPIAPAHVLEEERPA